MVPDFSPAALAAGFTGLWFRLSGADQSDAGPSRAPGARGLLAASSGTARPRLRQTGTRNHRLLIWAPGGRDGGGGRRRCAFFPVAVGHATVCGVHYMDGISAGAMVIVNSNHPATQGRYAHPGVGSLLQDWHLRQQRRARVRKGGAGMMMVSTRESWELG